MAPRSNFRKKLAVALVALIAFGAARVTWEDASVRPDLKAADLLEEPPGRTLKDGLAQSSMFALLGGMRPQIAFYFTLNAFESWRDKDWENVEKSYRLAWAMQPRDIDSRTTGAWHLHTNAASDYYNNQALPLEVRLRRSQEFVDKGVMYLREAATELPDEPKLWEALGTTLKDKKLDYCGAAEAYKEALDTGKAMGYMERFYLYNLAKCPGSERAAYDGLMALYREDLATGKHLVPTVISTIKRLENELNIPFFQWIPERDPDVVREEQIRENARRSIPIIGQMPGLRREIAN